MGHTPVFNWVAIERTECITMLIWDFIFPIKWKKNDMKVQGRKFLNVVFTEAIQNAQERPQCILCGVVLSNESFKLKKMDRHL